MPVPDLGPLTDPDRKRINERLAELSQLRQDLAKAQSAGVDCAERNSYCDYLQQQLERMKSAYFPNKP